MSNNKTSIYIDPLNTDRRTDEFIGSIGTIICSLFVIISFICTPELRYYPSVIIFYKCLVDCSLAVCLAYFFLKYPTESANDIICLTVGHVSLFVYLCCMFYLIKLMNDLRTALKHPFSSSYLKPNIIKTNIIIFSISAIISSFIRFECDVSSHILIYLLPFPFITTMIFTIYVTITAYCKLKKGLPNTFNIRRKVIRNAWLYCIIYFIYYSTIAFFYLGSLIDISNNDSIWIDMSALSFSCLGITDFIVFIIINYDKYQTLAPFWCCCKVKPLLTKEKILIPKNKQRYSLQPLSPKSLNNRKQNSCVIRCNRLCDKIGISVVQNKQNKTINEALMIEILAHTTDGIAQAVDQSDANIDDIKDDKYYPQSIDDIRPNVINEFWSQIERNWAVTLKPNAEKTVNDTESPIIKLKGCCVNVFNSTISVVDDFELITAVPIKGGNYNNGSISLSINDSDLYHQMPEPRAQQAGNIKKRAQFVDYAPMIFRYIRLNIIGLSDTDYKLSIIPSSADEQLRVLKECKCGEGKSGAFFYITHDSKFVVKTIPKHEVEKLIEILPEYLNHLINNRRTIISKYVGLHSIEMYGLIKYFVVMDNVFVSDIKPNEIYDLKGSWINRQTNHPIHSGKTMKDLDLKRLVNLKDYNKDNIINQLKKDTEFLASHYIMDYSLLLGICYMKIECEDNNNNNNDRNDSDYLGGVRADIMEAPGLYYFGIIDTLQGYTFRKRMENWMKVYIKRSDKYGISCIEPIKYQERFMKYMENIMISGKEYKNKLNLTSNKFAKEQILIYPSSKNIKKHLIEISRQKSRSYSVSNVLQLQSKINDNNVVPSPLPIIQSATH